MKRHLFSASFGSYSFRKKITPWCILALPMIFTVWLKYYPILSAFYISLFQYDPIQSPGTFVGLSNYVSMFKMPYYWEAWKNTFIFLLLQLAMCFFIPLIQALFLNELTKLQKSLTTLYILPALIPTSVNVIIWRWIWHPDYGVANQIIKFPDMVKRSQSRKVLYHFPRNLRGRADGAPVSLGHSGDFHRYYGIGFSRWLYRIWPNHPYYTAEHLFYDLYSADYERHHHHAAAGRTLHVCFRRAERRFHHTGHLHL